MNTIQRLTNFVAVIRKESGHLLFAITDENDFSEALTEGRELLKTYQLPYSCEEIEPAVCLVRDAIVALRPPMELQLALVERCLGREAVLFN